MSNSFTYQIDERNLRIQLKSIQAPVREDAWHKFEIFAEANVYKQPQTRLQNLQIPLNRNVVLPVIFGMVIIMFSFLLFNFITIKNPGHAKTTVIEEPAMLASTENAAAPAAAYLLGDNGPQ